MSEVWICGARHDKGLDDFATLQTLEGFLFFSYRRGFARIEGNLRLSGDTGWGCSHRSGQMLLGRALVVLRLGQDWSRKTEQSLAELYRIVELFADVPAAPFSIHALTIAATRLTDKKLGDWLGPSSVSVCLRSVVNARQPWGLRAVLAQDGGIIYRDAVPRNGPVLILVPLRLGLDELNPSYLPLLRAVLRCPLCVGIIGGRDSSSFYFVGYSDDDVLILDPHTTQPAFENTEHPIALESFQPSPSSMPMRVMDPSVSVGFVLSCYAQLDDLEAFLKRETAHLPYSITVEEKAMETALPALKADMDDWVAL
jgi:cysteine protease ATG4